MIPTLVQLYSKILRNLIENDIKSKQPEEKAGFTARRRSGMENIFRLKTSMERPVQKKIESRIA